jgi:hypothetical protein
MPTSSNPTSRKGGRKGWTTQEQYRWLEEQATTYIALKTEGKRLNMFWLQLYDDWFTRWPEGSTNDGNEKQKLVCTVVRSWPKLIDCLL